MSKIYTVYKVENKINKKCYIGYDSNWPKRKETPPTGWQLGMIRI